MNTENPPDDKNGEPKPTATITKHLRVLVGIALVWLVLFIFVVAERGGEVRAMLPVVTVIFILYFVYATISVLKGKL